MLDSLLGRKFSAKCKQSIKCIKTRICLIRKRKQATVNFLKKDVVDLLANGHDTNAIGRMDGLIVEMNRLSCYDMIEHYCELILSQLSCLQKKRECPPEEMEAMATLIFAAARFSDLPELGDLRHAFISRYGNNSGSFVNAEFMEKISAKSFSQDKKLKLMEMISQEFSIPWNAKLFNKSATPSAPDLSRNTNTRVSNMRQEASTASSNENNGISANKKQDIAVETKKQESSGSEGSHAADKHSALRQEASIVELNENNGTTANKKQDIATEIRKQEASRSDGNIAAEKHSALKQQRHAQVKDIHMVSSSRTSYAVEYIEKADELRSGKSRDTGMAASSITGKGSHEDSNWRYQQDDVTKNITRAPSPQNARISPVQGRHERELEPNLDRVNSIASQIKTNGYLKGENSFGSNVYGVSLDNAKKISYSAKPEDSGKSRDTGMAASSITGKGSHEDSNWRYQQDDVTKNITRAPSPQNARISPVQGRHERELEPNLDRVNSIASQIKTNGYLKGANSFGSNVYGVSLDNAKKISYSAKPEDNDGLLYTNDQDRYAMKAKMDYDRSEKHIRKQMMQSERSEMMDTDRQERHGREPMTRDGSKGKIDNDGQERHDRERQIHYDRNGKREKDDQERYARETNHGRMDGMVSQIKFQGNNHGIHVVDQYKNGNESGHSESLPGSYSEPEKQANGLTKHGGGVKNMNGRDRNKIPPYVKPNGHKDGCHVELLDDDVNDLASSVQTKEFVTRVKDPVETANGCKIRKQQDGEPSSQQEPRLGDVKSTGHVPRNLIPPYVKYVSTKNGTLKENQMEPHISASSDNQENGISLPDKSIMQKDILVSEKIPRPRSVRRKHSKMQMVDENNEVVDGGSVESQIPIERKHGERQRIATVEDGKAIRIASERKHSERRRTIPVEDEYNIQNPSERKQGDRQKTVVLENGNGIQAWDERKHSERQRKAFAEYEYGIPIPSEKKHGEKQDTATMEDDSKIQIQIIRKHSERRRRATVEDEYANQIQHERKIGERRGRAIVEDDYDSQIPSERKHGERWGRPAVEDDYGIQIPIERKHEDIRERDMVEGHHRTETPNVRKHGERRRATVIEEDYDEEEMFMDKLLMHYSRKGMDHGNSKSRIRTKSTDFVAEDCHVRTPNDIHHKDHYNRPEQVRSYARANSLPSKQVDEADAVKRTLRAASMEPDVLSQCGGRVHPRLPNYDELAARFHALKS